MFYFYNLFYIFMTIESLSSHNFLIISINKIVKKLKYQFDK